MLFLQVSEIVIFHTSLYIIDADRVCIIMYLILRMKPRWAVVYFSYLIGRVFYAELKLLYLDCSRFVFGEIKGFLICSICGMSYLKLNRITFTFSNKVSPFNDLSLNTLVFIKRIIIFKELDHLIVWRRPGCKTSGNQENQSKKQW